MYLRGVDAIRNGLPLGGERRVRHRSNPGVLLVTCCALLYCPAANLCAGQVRRPVVAEVHEGREVGKSVAARR